MKTNQGRCQGNEVAQQIRTDTYQGQLTAISNHIEMPEWSEGYGKKEQGGKIILRHQKNRRGPQPPAPTKAYCTGGYRGEAR